MLVGSVRLWARAVCPWVDDVSLFLLGVLIERSWRISGWLTVESRLTCFICSVCLAICMWLLGVIKALVLRLGVFCAVLRCRLIVP
jgi:hypothetical protein